MGGWNVRKSIKFRVKEEGKDMLPPKKGGVSSMWNKKASCAQKEKLIALRRAAHSAMDTCGYEAPLVRDIRLTLDVHVRSQDRVNPGDLDNFITGVCDGLSAKKGRAIPDDRLFNKSEPALDPCMAIAIEDDGKVIEIRAKRIDDVDPQCSCWYEVKLEEQAPERTR